MCIRDREDAYRAKMKDTEPKKDGAEKALPELTEGQTLSVAAAIVKEGKDVYKRQQYPL